MVFVILCFSSNFFSVLFLKFFLSFFFHFKFQVVLTKRFLVRPNGQIGEKEQNNKKERTSTPETVTSAASTITEPAQSAPEFSFDETVLQKVGTPLKDVIEQVNITGMQIFLFILITIPFTFNACLWITSMFEAIWEIDRFIKLMKLCLPLALLRHFFLLNLCCIIRYYFSFSH